uniref:Coiled-coil domain-containing protein n=1 Tax=Anopheles christyi TaxID=43041 RepID=A0A182JW98_9DIPT
MEAAVATSHSNDTLQQDASLKNITRKKAIQVSTYWDSKDSDHSDTGDEASNGLELKGVNWEAKLCKHFSNMSLAESQSELTINSTGRNKTFEETQGKDFDSTLLPSDTDEEDRELYAEDNVSECSSDSSDTLDAGSEEENEEQPFPNDRGGGDADLNLNTDPGSQIIKVKIAPKQRDRDPEAYKKWLKTKNEEIRKTRETDTLAKLASQRQKELEEEKRKEESKKKIREWMERKKQNNAKKSTNTTHAKEKQHSQDSSSEHLNCDPDAKFKSWLLNVRKREEEKRLRTKTVMLLEQKIQNEKKKISEEIYQEWLKTSKNKPKPVPLNQGPHTLRGTVSKIFINPEPWKNNCEE